MRLYVTHVRAAASLLLGGAVDLQQSHTGGTVSFQTTKVELSAPHILVCLCATHTLLISTARSLAKKSPS